MGEHLNQPGKPPIGAAFFVLGADMFNGFQPSFPMPYQLPQMQQQPQQAVQFVNGIESAQMYQLPPNSQQILMDRSRARFYMVETDASGQKSVSAYDFQAAEDAPTEYATVKDLESLRSSYESLAEQVRQFASAAAARPDAVPAVNQPAAGQGAGGADAAQRANHARPVLPSI